MKRIKFLQDNLPGRHAPLAAVENLRARNTLSLRSILESRQADAEWSQAEKLITRYHISDGTGGVNPGDRRAIYYLISALKPSSVLEVGKHIGASTIHIAAALHDSQIGRGGHARLLSVDIRNVNCDKTRLWEKFGTKQSPYAMIRESGFGRFVRFATSTSVDFAAYCRERFDFIFLDRDHAEKTVLTEPPAVLPLLNPDGVILLHDFFPNRVPRWSDGSVIAGPCEAIKKLRSEAYALVALPLGGLQ